MVRILSILMGLVVAQQVSAVEASALSASPSAASVDAAGPTEEGDAARLPSREPLNIEGVENHGADPGAGAVMNVPKARWIAPEPAEAKVINEQSSAPAKVRIGLRLTPFKKVVTRGRDGTAETRYVPGEALRHTLRARLNKTNHFFVADWHVESVPMKWVQKTRRYEVRLNIYRRFGAFGQLEESVGSVDVQGVLDEQKDNVHVLLGVGRKRLRDKLGNPLADVVAGFAPGGTTPKEPKLSQRDASPSRAPVEAPATFDGHLVPGRF